MFKLQPTKDQLVIIFKLLHDTLLVLLLFFVLALIAEGLLPGIISSHIGLYKIAMAILINILFIFALQKITHADTESGVNKKIAYALLFVLLLLLFNSLLKLNIFLNIFILISISVAAYFITKVLQED